VVQAFYFQEEVFPDKSLIISTIKGKKISLNPMIITEKLKIPHDGSCVYGDDWDLDLNVNLSKVIWNVFQPNTTEFVSSKLHYIPKMLNLLSQHSLIPRKGNHGNVTKKDLLLIYHKFYEIRLSLPHVIIHHMISAAQDTSRRHGLPYGMILTRLFRELGVDLEGEKSVLKITKFTPKNISHMKSELPTESILSKTPSKRKRDEEETDSSDYEFIEPQKFSPERPAERFPDRSQHRSPILEEDQDLLADFRNQTTIFNDIQATEVLRNMNSKTPPTKVSNTNHLFTNLPQTSFSPLFNSDSISKFFAYF